MTDKKALALADTIRAKGWIVWHICTNCTGGWQVEAQRTRSRPLESILSPHHWTIVQAQPAPRLKLGDWDWTRWVAEIPPALDVALPPAGQRALFEDAEGQWLPGLWPEWMCPVGETAA